MVKIIEITALPLDELRLQWAQAWGRTPHRWISRQMLEQSLICKRRMAEGNGLTRAQNARLQQLISAYKRNPNTFTSTQAQLKPGTKLVRRWRGQIHVVQVLEHGFAYQDKTYKSLTAIADEITGSRWNGWIFFGLQKKKARV